MSSMGRCFVVTPSAPKLDITKQTSVSLCILLQPRAAQIGFRVNQCTCTTIATARKRPTLLFPYFNQAHFMSRDGERHPIISREL